MNLDRLQLLVLDVDGVLTDGGVTLQDSRQDSRVFHVQDGCAMKLWQKLGHRIAFLSGRLSATVDYRAAQLGIETVRQGVKNKLTEYIGICRTLGVSDDQVCYMGDDLPDLAPMARCIFPVAPAGAVPAVKRIARYVTQRQGGQGAVAEVIELILRKQGKWNPSILETP